MSLKNSRRRGGVGRIGGLRKKLWWVSRLMRKLINELEKWKLIRWKRLPSTYHVKQYLEDYLV